MKLLKIISEIKQMKWTPQVGKYYSIKIYYTNDSFNGWEKEGDHFELDPEERKMGKEFGDSAWYWILDMKYTGMKNGYFRFEDNMDSFELNIDPADAEERIRNSGF
jgi:hypothetical protein